MSFTIVHAPFAHPLTKPYAVGLVALDEGTRLVAELIDADHESLRIGMPATPDFMDCQGDLSLSVFPVSGRRRHGSAA